MFRAFSLTPTWEVKTVLLGQDPYPTPGFAMGAAFSVAPDVNPLPQSLQNIFKELKTDVGVEAPNGDLIPWARKGVLLLNASLTVEAGRPGSHEKLWAGWTSQVIKYLIDKNVPFILLGKKAQVIAKDVPKELRIEAPHPSPLSAHSGFFGSHVFSRLNSALKAKHADPIDWSLTLPDAEKKNVAAT